MERKELYNIFYRLKGSTGSWYPSYRRGYSFEVIQRKYDKSVKRYPYLDFVIVIEPDKVEV